MFSCFICSLNFTHVNLILKHLRIYHALFEHKKLNLRCCVSNCSLIFSTFSGLRKHLLMHDKNFKSKSSKEQPDSITDDRNCENNVHATASNSEYSTTFDTDSNTPLQIDDSHFAVDTECFPIESVLKLFFSQSASLMLPASQVQSLIESVIELISNIFGYLKTKSKNTCTTDFLSEYEIKIENEFSNYKTIYRRNKMVNQNVILPQDIAIGSRSESVLDRKQNVRLEKIVPKTFQYIPLLESLKQIILKNHHLQSQIRSKSKDDSSMGSYLKNNLLYNTRKYFIALQLYYDDFETTNPIGSKATCHKMGAIYFSIIGISSIQSSKLNNIHLLALFYTSDLKCDSYGEEISLNSILHPIVKDLKILESEGIIVDGFEEPIYGTLTSLSHDNLGANALHGMVLSFQAHYCCRICLIHKNDAKTKCTDSLELWRTSSLYEQHAKTAERENKHEYGIKFRSILNDLQHFKLCDAVSVDLMHDILEGVIHVDLKFIIQDLIKNKLISLEQINERIKVFDYGNLSQANKPSAINLDKSNLNQRASQSWCLAIYFPLMFNDIVNLQFKQKWKILILLLQIMCICFSRKISAVLIDKLRDKITQHHTLFQEQFNHHLTQKMHFLIHYPEVIKRMGPLINLWTMRYEGKHYIFKCMATKFRNFINIAKTLATRYQQSVLLEKHENLVLIGPSQTVLFKNFEFRRLFIDLIEEFHDNLELHLVKWLKLGFLYKKDLVLCTGIYNGIPSFENILEVVIIEGHYFLVTRKLRTLEFNSDLNAYKVFSDNSLNVVDLNFLINKEPFNLHQTCSDSSYYYLVPKYYFLT